MKFDGPAMPESDQTGFVPRVRTTEATQISRAFPGLFQALNYQFPGGYKVPNPQICTKFLKFFNFLVAKLPCAMPMLNYCVRKIQIK